MDYLISVINRLNFNLVIFSLGCSTAPPISFKRESITEIDSKTKYIFISSFNFLFEFVSRIWLYLQVVNLILFRISKEDIVVVYHSLHLSRIINFLKPFRKFTLIFEVEEIYSAVLEKGEGFINNEIRSLMNANGYILVNDLLANKMKITNKPYVVCYGGYVRASASVDSLSHNTIHLVYAGYLGGKESDLSLALETIILLPNNYSLNILGYGDSQDVNILLDRIEQINLTYGREKVKYHGCLFGEEYSRFLRSCHIGLSTRVLSNKYSDYTFPSKILVYLANNLIPVSPRLSCISESRIADRIVFYNDSNPQSVVAAILNIEFRDNGNSNIDLISKLDTEFLDDLKHMLSNDTN
jgi:hypothetical protein